MIKSLIINPGSTSTKLGIFEDETLVSEETLRHTTEEIAQFDKIVDQIDFRKNLILNFLKESGQDIKSFNVIVGRGGLLKPIPSGTYKVTDKLIEDIDKAEKMECDINQAKFYHDTVLKDMEEVRVYADKAEPLIPEGYLPYPTYEQILFYV